MRKLLRNILWKTIHFKNSSFLDGQTMTQCVWYWRLHLSLTDIAALSLPEIWQ
jgi:hypothetical protein